MKRVLIAATTFCFCSVLLAGTGELDRLDKKTVKSMTAVEMQDRTEVLEERLTEIQSIDFDELDRVERKSMKKELRYINNEMSALANGGIYISTGAIIIILLLIIIL